MSAKRVFDSSDLVRHIYSFGDPSHRTFTHRLGFDVRAYPELFQEKYTERCLQSVSSYTIHDYLFEYSGRKIQWYMKNYKRCFCCARHSQDKPTWIQDKIVYPPQSVFENHESECDCCCRSLSRRFTEHLNYRELMYS
jgi:hypothetical protein